MDTIIQQQLQLHFGDDYDMTYNKARSYVKGLIGKSWWVDRRSMLSSEGPLARMVEDCLASIIDKGDVIEGYKAYTSYLSSLYGSTNSHALSVGETIWAPNDSEHTLWSTMGAYNSPHALGTETSVEDDMSDRLTVFDDEQADYISVYSTMGVDAAADEWELTPEQARTRRNTIKRTVSRRLGS